MADKETESDSPAPDVSPGGSDNDSAQGASEPSPTIDETKPDEKKEPDKISGLDTVITRNIFYRDGYRRLTKIALIEAFAIAGLIVALAITIGTAQPQDRFFATTSDGRLIRMVPLSQPNLNDAAIVSWAARAASDVMTFGFHDYKRRLQETSEYFTRTGWKSFSGALENSRMLQMVERNQQVVTAAPRSAPVILQQGLMNGVYRWVVELPLIVTYQSGSAQDSNTMTVRMVIVRTSTLDSPDGVGIQQWIAR